MEEGWGGSHHELTTPVEDLQCNEDPVPPCWHLLHFLIRILTFLRSLSCGQLEISANIGFGEHVVFSSGFVILLLKTWGMVWRILCDSFLLKPRKCGLIFQWFRVPFKQQFRIKNLRLVGFTIVERTQKLHLPCIDLAQNIPCYVLIFSFWSCHLYRHTWTVFNGPSAHESPVAQC